MRIVIRIGGSVIASPLNPELLVEYAGLLRNIKALGHSVAVVVGGGALAREFIAAAKAVGLAEKAQDRIAILVSRLFAQLFLERLGKLGCKTISLTVKDATACLQTGRIAVMGGLKPGMTTDTVAALVAERAKADLLVKATDQEGVFDKDPRMHDDAVKLDHLTYGELSRVLAESRHKAGIHQIIDPEAVKILKRSSVKVAVVNGFKPKTLLLAIEGKCTGTIIE